MANEIGTEARQKKSECNFAFIRMKLAGCWQQNVSMTRKSIGACVARSWAPFHDVRCELHRFPFCSLLGEFGIGLRWSFPSCKHFPHWRFVRQLGTMQYPPKYLWLLSNWNLYWVDEFGHVEKPELATRHSYQRHLSHLKPRVLRCDAPKNSARKRLVNSAASRPSAPLVSGKSGSKRIDLPSCHTTWRYSNSGLIGVVDSGIYSCIRTCQALQPPLCHQLLANVHENKRKFPISLRPKLQR